MFPARVRRGIQKQSGKEKGSRLHTGVGSRGASPAKKKKRVTNLTSQGRRGVHPNRDRTPWARQDREVCGGERDGNHGRGTTYNRGGNRSRGDRTGGRLKEVCVNVSGMNPLFETPKGRTRSEQIDAARSERRGGEQF